MNAAMSQSVHASLPRDIESLLRAADAETLPASAKLEHGFVPDLNKYVLAWGVTVFWNRDEALPHLWEVWRYWHDHLEQLRPAQP